MSTRLAPDFRREARSGAVLIAHEDLHSNLDAGARTPTTKPTVLSCPDCGWVGKPLTPGQAAYALRRHSCEKHRQRALARQRGAARKARVDRRPKPCLHKLADHQHGTHACYVHDRCRCFPCSAANAAYETRRVRQQAYGRWNGLIDAGPVREHVVALRAQGLGLKRIAALSGVSHGSLSKLVYGHTRKDGSHRPPAERVQPSTAQRLLAVEFEPVLLTDGIRVDAIGTQRRIQALVVVGWSQTSISARLGIGRSNFGKTLEQSKVTVAFARKVADLYDEWWDVDPSITIGVASAARARTYARQRGWPPPMAWDDGTIDDPEAQPCVAPEPETDQHHLDEIAVLRIMNGTLQVAKSSRSPERVEAIRRLALAGLADSAIGEIIGMTKDAVCAQRLRNDIAPGVPSGRPPLAAGPADEPDEMEADIWDLDRTG